MIALLIILLSTVSIFAKSELLSELSEKGLPAKVTVCVRDQNGDLVSNANVRFFFGLMSKSKSKEIETKTDIHGLAVGESRVNHRIVITISKDGYYDSFYRHNVWNGSGGYETGRWEPWNPILNVTLFEKRLPRSDNYFPGLSFKIEQNVRYGVDLLQREVFPINESSRSADFTITSTGNYYSTDTTREDDWIAKDALSFCKKGDGIIEKKRNRESELVYQYQAPMKGYQSLVEYTYMKKGKEKERIKQYPSETDLYLIFRITRVTKDGVEEHYYGIIESLSFSKNWKTGKIVFRISYRINSEPGDRNIEYIQ